MGRGTVGIMRLIVLAAFVLAALASGAQATDYYVNDGSTDLDNWCTAAGSDSNDGLSPGAPKATVQAIVDGYALKPGENVYIDTGTYNLTANITVGSADGGASGSPLTFAASPYGVTINRGSTSSTRVWDIAASYVALTTATSNVHGSTGQSWMKITGGYCGVYANAPGFRISRCDVCANSNYGIRSDDPSVVIEHCIARGSTAPDGVGIFIPFGNSPIVKNCTIYGNAKYGICADGGWTICENNVIWADGAGSYALYDTWGSVLGEYDYNNLYATNGASVGGSSADSVPSDVSISWPTLAEWRAAKGQNMHSISRDPMFVNALGADFHLQSSAGSYHGGLWAADAGDSLCIDAGHGDAGAEPSPNMSPLHGADFGIRNLGAYGGTEQASKTYAVRHVVLYEPIGGENYLNQATPVPIRWTWLGTDWQSGDTLRFDYLDTSAAWVAISGAYSVAVDAGAISWDIASLTHWPRYLVRTTCNQAEASADQSAVFFRVGEDLILYVNDSFTTNDNWCTAIGSDANDGCTPATPKATVHAMLSAYDLEGGDTVCIDTGAYDLTGPGNITVGALDGGTPSRQVTFVASPCGVTLNRGSTDSSARVWDIYGAGYITLTTAASKEYPLVAQRFMEVTGSYCGILTGPGCRITRCDVCDNTNCGIWIGYVYNHPSGIVEDCLITGSNVAVNVPGAPSSTVRNCTMYGNDVAVYVEYSDNLNVENNAIWADGADAFGIIFDAYSAVSGTFDYNNIHATNGAATAYWDFRVWSTLADWHAGTGKDAHSISVDPLFADAAGGDFHLKSLTGRYDPSTGLPPEVVGAWVTDTVASPCIDAGDPASAYSKEPTPNGRRVNMGAYGDTEQASMSSALMITTASLPNGRTDVAYSESLAATGGVTPYTWSISAGSLPAGLSLVPSTGVISGTPTGTGAASFTVAVVDTDTPQATATKALSITIAEGLFIVNQSLPGAPPGVAYSETLIAQGGVPAYSWSIASGSLPPGLSLDPATGVISGTPTACAIYNFTVGVTDSQSPPDTAEKALHIIISDGPTYHFIISDNEQSTTSTNYVAKTTLTFDPPTADDWLIFGFCEWRCPNPAYATYVQLFIDGAGEGQNTRKPVARTDYMPFITVKGTQLAPGPHTIRLMYRAGNSAAAAYVRRARICAVRKAALEYYNVARDGGAPLTQNLQDITSLTWTPVRAGNYIVISTAELNATTAVSTRLQTVYNGVVNDEQYMRAADNGDFTTFMSFNYLVAPALVPIEHKITASKVGADAINHYVRRARILALRLSNGRFNNTAAGYATEQATTQTTFQQCLSTTWTYGVNGNWLFLNSARMANGSTSYQTELRAQLNDDDSAVCGQQLMRPKHISDLLNYSSIDVRYLTTARRLDMDYRTTNAAGAAKVKRLRFYGLPLDAQ